MISDRGGQSLARGCRSLRKELDRARFGRFERAESQEECVAQDRRVVAATGKGGCVLLNAPALSRRQGSPREEESAARRARRPRNRRLRSFHRVENEHQRGTSVGCLCSHRPSPPSSASRRELAGKVLINAAINSSPYLSGRLRPMINR